MNKDVLQQAVERIRHTLMTGLAHNDAIAALNKLAAMLPQHPGPVRAVATWRKAAGNMVAHWKKSGPTVEAQWCTHAAQLLCMAAELMPNAATGTDPQIIPCGRPSKGLCNGGPECWCKHGEPVDVTLAPSALQQSESDRLREVMRGALYYLRETRSGFIVKAIDLLEAEVGIGPVLPPALQQQEVQS